MIPHACAHDCGIIVHADVRGFDHARRGCRCEPWFRCADCGAILSPRRELALRHIAPIRASEWGVFPVGNGALDCEWRGGIA